MQQTLTPSRHLEGRRAYERPAEPFNTVAWKASAPTRFDPRVSNGTVTPSPVQDALDGIPAWLHIIGGGVIAALVGALLGGALHI